MVGKEGSSTAMRCHVDFVLIAEGIAGSCAYFSDPIEVIADILVHRDVGNEALEAKCLDRRQAGRVVVTAAKPFPGRRHVFWACHTAA